MEIVILLVVALLVFGPKRLPEMGRSIGKGMREFKDSISGKDEDEVPPPELPAARRARSGTEERHDLLAGMRRIVPRRLAPGEEATLVEHLGELRTRLVYCLIAVGAAFIVTFVFHNQILDWLNAPLPAQHKKPATFGVAEPFIISVMVSFWGSLALAMPVILWQMWAFFAPAVAEDTQRRVLGFVCFATVLFAVGSPSATSSSSRPRSTS